MILNITYQLSILIDPLAPFKIKSSRMKKVEEINTVGMEHPKAKGDGQLSTKQGQGGPRWHSHTLLRGRYINTRKKEWSLLKASG
jgi:hypothetical protein